MDSEAPDSGAGPGVSPPEGPGPPDAPEEIFRLHPLTPIALGGRILGLLVVFALFSLAGQKAGDGSGPNVGALAFYAGLAVLVLLRGVVTVAVTRYHLLGGELRIDSGLLRKQSKRVRLNRVQSVDVLEPFSARIFGLAEVKVTTAGTERSAVRLRYLPLPVARRLRADMLGRSAGGWDQPAPEAPERPVVAVPHGVLVRAVLLEMVSWRLILLLLGPILTVVGRENEHRATSGVGILLILWFGILILSSVWRRMSTLWDFTLTESPDGLRISHGLLSTSRQTVPPGRIQAVLIHQPVAWRPLGWAQIRMNVAGYVGSSNAKSTVLLPVADLDYAMSLVGWLLGGIDLGAIPLERPPRRAAFRSPLWWRAQLAGSDEHLFVARHGLVSRTMDIVPHERTQSVRLTAGPLQRALRLASMHLDSTRGPVRTRAANRDALGARAMLDRQVDLARRARLRQWEPMSAPPR
ncbi:MAG: PH domain-containing protein [Acidimicrobiales bacterium]